ncbi:MAG: AsmA family protein, partial [Kordiimonadaceae bacterium]|nr:AsmA family protein [Kordiimonadaceae bacterium]
MKRFSLSKVIYWSAGGLIGTLALASLVLSFLDWDQYRETLSDLASAQMDMRVEVEGDISLAIFPRPSLSAEAVRLFPKTEGFSDAVATAERIRLKLGFGGVLQGRLSLQSLTLDGLELTLEERETNKWRVRGWPENGSSDVGSGGDGLGAGSTAGPNFDLNRFRLSGGRIVVAPRGMAPVVLEGVKVRINGLPQKGALSWDGKFSIAGQEIKTVGRVRPVTVRDETAINTEFSLAGSTAVLTGRIQKGGDFTGRLKFETTELNKFVAAAAATAAVGAQPVPDLPLKLALQIDKKSSITKIVSRSLSFEETLARVDLTLAQTGTKRHVNGTLSLGVINLDTWIAALPAPSEQHGEIKLTEIDYPDAEESWTGAIDVTVEGIQVRGGLGQRIDAVVAFDAGGAYIGSLQALLPGATTVAFAGKLGTDVGQGTLNLQTGKMSDLASWVGIALPKNLAAGRLTTAGFKTEIDLTKTGWHFTAIDGFFDTSKITGAISGSFDSFVPQQVKLQTDTINLDAYFPVVSSENTPAATKPNTDQAKAFSAIEFDVEVGRLQWLKEGFSKVRLVGKAAGGGLEFSHAVAHQGVGSISLTGSVLLQADVPAVDVSIEAHEWPLPFVRFLVPEARKPLLAIGFTEVDATFTAVGALDALRVGLEANKGPEEVVFAGVVGVVGKQVASVDMQGSLIHSNLAPLARLLNVADLKTVPVRATISLAKSARDKPLEAKISGDFVGGNLVATIVQSNSLEALDLSYNHDNAGALANMLGMAATGLDRAASLRSEILYSRSDDGADWSLKVPMFRNGDISVNGDIEITGHNQLNGAINITGGNFSGINNRSSVGQPSESILHQFAEYGGRLALSVTDTQIAGQSLTAPNVTLIFGDRMARFSLGEGAFLNQEPASFDMNASLEGDFLFDGDIKTNKLDVGGLLSSEGISAAVKVHTSLETSFSGKAAGPDILRTLTASGSTAGGVGELNFISVDSISDEVTAATSRRSFLGKIGNLLRTGTTVVKTVDSRFSVDSGVMLVETARAAGDWGDLTLNGQVNFLDEYLTLKGALTLSKPVDVPPIPVSYEGQFSGPTIKWSSRMFERFVLAMIERRMRTALFKELEKREETSGEVGNNPGLAVFSRAFGLLGALRDAQQVREREK